MIRPQLKNSVCTSAATNHPSKQKVERGNEQYFKAVTARIFKNKIAIKVNEIERTKEDLKFEDIAELVSGTRGKQVFVKGDPDLGIWTAGQVLGLIDDIPTCHQLVTRIS
ncbi:Putative 2-nitropropane dioxygenase [Rhizopus microsporus]|nr:Putative 2-nitropropane dioxygenase [Rhizopus microsporus]